MDLRHGRLVTLHLHLHRGPYLTDPGMVTRCDMIAVELYIDEARRDNTAAEVNDLVWRCLVLVENFLAAENATLNRVIPLRGLSGDTAAGILEQFDNFAEETATGCIRISRKFHDKITNTLIHIVSVGPIDLTVLQP
ncbi:hypothetical protein KCU68_g51, partial [Aureobasidium melanogenum]